MGTRTTVTGTDIEAGTGFGGGEKEFLAERATCDYPDNEVRSE